jgi:8-oxo-dGTP pyrophosphatase MutT (NUDIX family)
VPYSAAAVIVEDRAGRVLLLLRGPTAPWMPLRWCLPGGRIEPGETAVSAAAREVREETDLRVKGLVPIAAETDDGGTLVVFYAGRWTGQVQLIDDEHVSYVWISRGQAARCDLVPPQKKVMRWFAQATAV